MEVVEVVIYTIKEYPDGRGPADEERLPPPVIVLWVLLVWGW